MRHVHARLCYRLTLRPAARTAVLLAAIGMGCARPVVARVPVSHASPDRDSALALAALLPVDADECVIARPTLLARGLGAIYGPISQADVWVWQPGPLLVAYAQATWKRGGQKRWLTLLRFSAEQPAMRAWLTERAGLDLHWESSDAVGCSADRCPTLARFIDAHTLQLVRGAARSGTLDPKPRSACAHLLREHSAAFEVSFRREESLFIDAASDLPLHTSAWTQATPAGVVVQREELMADSAAAERALERDPCRELWGAGSAAVDAACERTRQDVLVHTSARLRWDDLRLRRDDDARHALAQRYAAALERARPDSAIDWSNLDELFKELSVRRTLLETSGADPRPTALELLRSVKRGLDLYPNEPRLMKLSTELERIGQVMTTGDRPAMTAP
jgi:hypothetical protein